MEYEELWKSIEIEETEDSNDINPSFNNKNIDKANINCVLNLERFIINYYNKIINFIDNNENINIIGNTLVKENGFIAFSSIKTVSYFRDLLSVKILIKHYEYGSKSTIELNFNEDDFGLIKQKLKSLYHYINVK